MDVILPATEGVHSVTLLLFFDYKLKVSLENIIKNQVLLKYTNLLSLFSYTQAYMTPLEVTCAEQSVTTFCKKVMGNLQMSYCSSLTVLHYSSYISLL